MDLRMVAQLALTEVAMDAEDAATPIPTGSRKATAQQLESDLAAHDRRFHPRGFHKGDSCKYREKLAAQAKAYHLDLGGSLGDYHAAGKDGVSDSYIKRVSNIEKQYADALKAEGLRENATLAMKDLSLREREILEKKAAAIGDLRLGFIRQALGPAEADCVEQLGEIVAGGGEQAEEAIGRVREIYEEFPKGDARHEAAEHILRKAPLPEGDDGVIPDSDGTVVPQQGDPITPDPSTFRKTKADIVTVNGQEYADISGMGRWRGAWEAVKAGLAGRRIVDDWDKTTGRWQELLASDPIYRAEMRDLQDGLMDGIGESLGRSAFSEALRRPNLDAAQKAYVASLYDAWTGDNIANKHKHLNRLIGFLAEITPKQANGQEGGEAPSDKFSAATGDWSGDLPSPATVFNAPVAAQNNAAAMKNIEQTVDDTLKRLNVDAIVSDISDAPTVSTVTLEVADDGKTGPLFAPETRRALNLALGTNSVKMTQRQDGKIQFNILKPKADVVQIGEAFTNPAVMQKAEAMALPMVVGKDEHGNFIVEDLAESPHQLVSGATGQGKSVDLNSGIASVLALKKPNEAGLFIIDGKGQEFSGLEGLPHLVHPVVNGTDNPKGVKSALLALRKEVLDRRRAMTGYKSLQDYNAAHPEDFRKPIMAVIDEYADLQSRDPSIQKIMDEIGRVARSVGVHMRVATQAPNKKLMDDLRSHFPTQHVYQSADRGASLATLGDTSGLLLGGKGDGYIVRGGNRQRMRGAYVDNSELGRLVQHYTGVFPEEYKSKQQQAGAAA